MNRRHILAPTFRRRAVLIPALCLGSAVAVADTSFGKETFSAELGVFLSDFDTDVELTGPRGGDSINLEDALGLESSLSAFSGSLGWRFAPRHRLTASYIRFDREATSAADRTFTVDTNRGTYTFNAGATVTTTFDWELIPVTYAYSFYKTDDLEIAASAGVHWFNFKTGFSGNATVTPPNGSPGPVASAAAVESTSGPLPVLGLQADFALSEKWTIGAHAGWFGLDYDQYSGELIDLGIGAEYWISDNFSAGLRYSYFNIDISVSDGPYSVGADYAYQGLQAYVGLRY